MIARTFSRATFGDLASYLARGRDGQHPERVAWTTARELPTEDPDLAAIVMQATAHLSRRVEYPCYHVVVAWDLADHPTRPQMESVVDTLAHDLDLTSHQLLMVAHNDRPHEHVHLMLNRVHPETGTAWERWWDRAAIERTLRAQERALHFREVPGRLARAPDQERPLPASRDVAAHRPLSTAAQTLLERTRAIAHDLRRVERWGDLELRLARDGLLLERQGRGLVVSDGHSTVPTARVHPELTLAMLERRFNDRYRDPLPAPAIQEIATQLRAITRDRELHDAVTAARKTLYAAEARAARHEPVDMGSARRQFADAEHALADYRRDVGPIEDVEHTVGLALARMLPTELRELKRTIDGTDLDLAITLKDHVLERLRSNRDQVRSR